MGASGNYGPDKAVDGDNKTRWSAIKGAAEFSFSL